MAQSSFLTGQMLLAMPGIDDPRFAGAAIAICAHDADGAFGVGIGRVIPRLGLHGLLGQLNIPPGEAPDAPVHVGGPVEPQRGFVIHGRDWGGEDTIDVAGRWSLTSTIDVLRAIAEGRGPTRWLAALGYAGWGPGQLDRELTGNGWFAAPTSEALLYETPVEGRWSAAFATAGIDARLLAAASGHA